MRIIQVPVANRAECSAALSIAFTLAKRSGADVVGLHVSSHKGMKAQASPSSAWERLWGDPVDWSAATEQEAQDNSRDAETLFTGAAKDAGYDLSKKVSKTLQPTAIWRERLGTPDYVMPIIGPAADMMVVSRPDKQGGRKAKVFMMQALMNSHRPVLIAPDKPVKTIAKHIAVAWNKSGEAAKALHASLPLLKQADTVTFVTIGQPTATGPSAEEMVKFLHHHGVNADVKKVNNGNDAAELEKACTDINADLLVMGAFSRSRASEFLFGGVTKHMLYTAEIPVLMVHS